MTTTNINVQTTYEGDGATLNFPITFDLFEKGVVKVFLIDETTVDLTTKSGLAETEQFESTNFTFDAATPPIQVQMNIAPTGTEKLRVERVSPVTQENVLPAGVDVNVTVEESVDRLTFQSQEQDVEIKRINTLVVAPATPTATSGAFPDWTTGTNFLKDQVVIQDLRLYRVTVDHLSNVFSTDLLNGDLELLLTQGIAGPQGDPGPQGPTGGTGATGAAGSNGSNGVNGIFSAIATQGEAQAGTDNTKGMSPLRVAEAITAQVDEAQIITNTTNIATLTNDVSALTSRVTILESLIQQSTGKFAGQQVLLDNQGAPVALLGLANGGVDDKGAAFSRDSGGTEFAEVMVYFRRVTDTENRFSSTDIVMQFVDGGWLIGRKGTEQLDETLDLDGVILSINAITGQVSYVSDDMTGANHDTQSLIAWLGQEISKC